MVAARAFLIRCYANNVESYGIVDEKKQLAGGSIAAGGGGMAVGHLVLPGIGVAVAVTVSSLLSYKEANKVSKACDEIEWANSKNQQTLSALGSHIRTLRVFEDRLVSEHRVLHWTVNQQCARLLPFGLLSHYYRLTRSWFTCSYFSPDDYFAVRQIENAGERFLSAMSQD